MFDFEYRKCHLAVDRSKLKRLFKRRLKTKLLSPLEGASTRLSKSSLTGTSLTENEHRATQKKVSLHFFFS